MADTIKTRLKLRYGTYSEWTTANPVLLQGEIAVVAIPASTGQATTEPTIMFKIGHDNKNFNDLNWTSALAGDVHSWAKAANKPEYGYGEITGLNAQLEAIREEISKGIADLTVADTGTAKFVTDIEYANGTFTVTRGALADDDIKNLASITALNSKVSALETKASTLETNLGTANTNIQKNAEDIAAANEALNNYKTEVGNTYVTKTADTAWKTNTFAPVSAKADANAAAIEKLNGTTDATSVTKKINDAKAEIKETTDDLNERTAALESTITGLSGAMHFKGVSTTDPKGTSGATVAGVSTWAKGDVVIFGNKEYVLNGDSNTAANWAELGDTTSEGNRISALETTVGNANSGLVKKVADLESSRATKTELASAKTELEGKITTANESIAANAEDIGELSTNKLDKSVYDTDQTALKGRVTTLETWKTAADAKVNGTGAGSIAAAQSTANAAKTAAENEVTRATQAEEALSERIDGLDFGVTKVSGSNGITVTPAAGTGAVTVSIAADLIIDCGGANG